MDHEWLPCIWYVVPMEYSQTFTMPLLHGTWEEFHTKVQEKALFFLIVIAKFYQRIIFLVSKKINLKSMLNRTL